MVLSFSSAAQLTDSKAVHDEAGSRLQFNGT